MTYHRRFSSLIGEPKFISKKDGLSLFVIKGIENYSGQTYHMASVRNTEGSALKNGCFQKYESDAVTQGNFLLDEAISEFQEE